MAPAELPRPQSKRVAMWPPQAMTGLGTSAVKKIVMPVGSSGAIRVRVVADARDLATEDGEDAAGIGANGSGESAGIGYVSTSQPRTQRRGHRGWRRRSGCSVAM